MHQRDHVDVGVLQEIADNYTKALQAAASGQSSSLVHIENVIPTSPLIKDDTLFQVMAIGGTNFKSATIRKSPTGLRIFDMQEKAQPPAFETKESFLSFINENLAPDIAVLALNFAFPIEPVFANTKLEGKLLFGTKEHTFEGLTGQNICTEIEKYVQEKQNRTIQVSVANDTICLLLSGKTQIEGNNIAAGIVGTGLNFGYFENATTLINTESGNFADFPLSHSGQLVDAESLLKGKYLLEKEVAGAYLYKHFNVLAKERNYFMKPLKNSLELTQLAAREDGSQACYLAHDILRRSAQLAACAIAGITKYKKEDLYFVMVGSLFWKGEGYKTIVRETVKQLIPDYQVQFLGIENSDLLGAAKLVA